MVAWARLSGGAQYAPPDNWRDGSERETLQVAPTRGRLELVEDRLGGGLFLPQLLQEPQQVRRLDDVLRLFMHTGAVCSREVDGLLVEEVQRVDQPRVGVRDVDVQQLLEGRESSGVRGGRRHDSTFY